jgi:hypothetical protein
MLNVYYTLGKCPRVGLIEFSLRKKTIEFQVQRKEDQELKKKIINRDVDIILEKIKNVGFSGLSDEEQSKLYEASKKMSKDGDRD